MNKEKILTCCLLIMMFPPAIFAQGCSDAGFCSAGTLKPGEKNDSLYRHSLKISPGFGIGEQGTAILQLTPELEFSLFKNNVIQLKAPYAIIHGNLGNTSGIGDITLSITQKLRLRQNLVLSMTIGGKIATGNANLKKDNLPLPMPYQISLGTYDIILGAGLKYYKWNLGGGFQGVLFDKNKNGFLKSEWLGNPDAQEYFESNMLRRSNDVLLRLERTFLYKKLYFSAGLLGIYRIEKDRITYPANSETHVALEGSDGLTLNLTGGVQYQASLRSAISLAFGTPLIVREVRPDGLTRALVVNASWQFAFGK